MIRQLPNPQPQLAGRFFLFCSFRAKETRQVLHNPTRLRLSNPRHSNSSKGWPANSRSVTIGNGTKKVCLRFTTGSELTPRGRAGWSGSFFFSRSFRPSDNTPVLCDVCGRKKRRDPPGPRPSMALQLAKGEIEISGEESRNSSGLWQSEKVRARPFSRRSRPLSVK